jgi:hypothetical protein
MLEGEIRDVCMSEGMLRWSGVGLRSRLATTEEPARSLTEHRRAFQSIETRTDSSNSAELSGHVSSIS